MNINRNNYEEYFLLYADKELSADEKNIVEQFVQQNPDLAEEFVMLQQSVIKPDDSIILEDKNSLYRLEEFINQANYEERFLLYADNELNLSEIEETEKFFLSNPSLQNEFTLLQKIKYEPDNSIVFPDKRLLYKRADDSKVIPFRWKAMAAAVLLGIGLWTGVSYLQKENSASIVVTNNNSEPKANPVKPVREKNNDQNIVKTGKDHQPLLKENTAGELVKKQPQKVLNKNFQEVKPEPKQLPEMKNEDVAIVDEPRKIDVINTNDLPQTNNTRDLADKTVTTVPFVENKNYVQAAAYVIDEEVKSENYVFYNITAEEFRKSKVGTFLKKVKRSIGSKIPFKNGSLKIGNVEIAKDIQN